MKTFKVLFIGLVATLTMSAQANDGLIIGGAIGAILGNGSGHQAEAAIAGAAAGYLIGESNRERPYYRERIYEREHNYDYEYYDRYPRETIIYYSRPVYREVYVPRTVYVYPSYPRYYRRPCYCR